MAIVIRKKLRPEQGQRFPYIPLNRAIERARELYRLANVHEVPVAAAVQGWSFSSKSSGGLQTVAALKAFGLIEDSGGGENRKVRLTDLALKILRDPREISPDRDALIRQAALTPALHREIIEKYQGMPPSDEALKAFLLMERGFKDDAVTDFFKEFTASMAFAKMTDSATFQDMTQHRPDTAQPVSSLAPPSPPSPPKPPVEEEPLNDIRAEFFGGKVRIRALLDKDGLEKLEKRIAAFKTLLS